MDYQKDLRFQDFGPMDQPSQSPFTGVNFSTDNRPPSSVHDGSKLVTSSSGNLDDDQHGSGVQADKPHFLSMAFYQQYFDVDTDQVQRRLLHSFFPRLGANFIVEHIQPIPDLYGPFWIAVTLIFTMAICGNIANYIHTDGQGATFENDFGFVTGATSLICSYVILVPLAFYSLCWYRKSLVQFAYLELLSAYGYSLAIFVPVSILWVIDNHIFRWALIGVSVALSGSVLVNSLWPAVKDDRNRLVAFAVIAGVFLLHALLAVGFKQYYFDTAHAPYSYSPLEHEEIEAPTPASLVMPTPIALNTEKPKANHSIENIVKKKNLDEVGGIKGDASKTKPEPDNSKAGHKDEAKPSTPPSSVKNVSSPPVKEVKEAKESSAPKA